MEVFEAHEWLQRAETRQPDRALVHSTKSPHQLESLADNVVAVLVAHGESYELPRITRQCFSEGTDLQLLLVLRVHGALEALQGNIVAEVLDEVFQREEAIDGCFSVVKRRGRSRLIISKHFMNAALSIFIVLLSNRAVISMIPLLVLCVFFFLLFFNKLFYNINIIVVLVQVDWHESDGLLVVKCVSPLLSVYLIEDPQVNLLANNGC